MNNKRKVFQKKNLRSERVKEKPNTEVKPSSDAGSTSNQPTVTQQHQQTEAL